MKKIILLLFFIVSTIQPAANAAQHKWGASYLDWSGALLSKESSVSQIIQPLELSDWMYWEVGWHWDNRIGSGYSGIQTKGYLANGKTSDLAIFSLWNSTSAIAGPNSGCLPFNHEGSGHSCRIPINIIKGNKYEITIQMDLEKGTRWWKASIKDFNTNKTEVIGSIEAPLENLEASNWNNFIEYWGQAVSCDSVGLANAKFYVPTSSNDQVEFSYPKFSRPKDVCVNSAADAPDYGYIGPAIMRFGGSYQPKSTITVGTKTKALLEIEKIAVTKYNGKRCSKFMSTRILYDVKFVCINNGKKLVWVKST